jgi:hypothetical protein
MKWLSKLKRPTLGSCLVTLEVLMREGQSIVLWQGVSDLDNHSVTLNIVTQIKQNYVTGDAV